MKFTVTKQMIKDGKPDNVCFCPVALAIKAKLPKLSFRIEASVVVIESVGYFELPQRTIRFIKKFDEGKPVRPFTFCLDLYKSEIAEQLKS